MFCTCRSRLFNILGVRAPSHFSSSPCHRGGFLSEFTDQRRFVIKESRSHGQWLAFYGRLLSAPALSG
eukprot:2496421-Pyramimonas_sp.AAC.1